MDDSGCWFSYHPLFGNFLRQRCQWELAAELPALHRAAAESWMAQGFPGEAIHHALASGDATMLRDVLLKHAWTLFNQSELPLLENSLKALPWEMMLENPMLVLLQAWLMQSQHRFSEVDSLLARLNRPAAARSTQHCAVNLMHCAPRWRLTMAIPMKRSGWRKWRSILCQRAVTTAALWQPRYMAK